MYAIIANAYGIWDLNQVLVLETVEASANDNPLRLCRVCSVCSIEIIEIS